MRRDVEMERERRVEANSMLEQERLTSNSLRRELDMERTQHHKTDVRYKAKVAELKASNDQLNQWVLRATISSAINNKLQVEGHRG